MAEEYREKMTQAKFLKMQEKLAYLKGERRTEIADQLEEARSHGDLSENAEYDEARNEQARLEAEIAQLEYTLDRAEIIQNITNDVVNTGCTVTLLRKPFNNQPEKHETLTIVGRSDANFAEHKISDDSPIGKAALGKRVGDEFLVEAPVGTMTFVVEEIIISDEFTTEKADA